MGELNDKVCLIAGASGAIGSAVARRFYTEGARLALTYLGTRPHEGLEDLLRNGPRAAHFRMDVRRWDEVEAVVARTEASLGPIQVLVNCVGVLGPIGAAAGASVQDWAETIETNLIGTFHLARAVLPGMVARRAGKIINFSGGGAAYARPNFTAYSASKAGVVRFTESLAEELRGTNIEVNAIAPGRVKSRMWDQVRSADAAAGPRAREELRDMDSSGGVPGERVAALALFLASDRSRGLTGRLISNVYDDWEHLEQRIPKIMQSEAWTLRRVPAE
jgi:3-oxoacyl-[acyl-carrier protein] reductase